MVDITEMDCIARANKKSNLQKANPVNIRKAEEILSLKGN